MRFAIQVAGGQIRHDKTGIEAVIEQAELAEAVGFDTVFVPDHYVFESLGQLRPAASTIFNFQMTASPAETRTVLDGMAALFGPSAEDVRRHPVALIGTAEEMAEELRRREAEHGLALLAVNFSSLEQVRKFGEDVITRM